MGRLKIEELEEEYQEENYLQEELQQYYSEEEIGEIYDGYDF